MGRERSLSGCFLRKGLIGRLFIRGHLACLFILISNVAYSATFYTAKIGNDSHSCSQAQNESTPKQTIAGGVGCLSSGDTLIVKAGIYDEQIGNSVPSGTSWSNVTTIRAYSGETVVIKRTSGSYPRCGYIYGATKSYIEIDGIDCDGNLGTAHNCYKVESGAHHIRFRNIECWQSYSSGFLLVKGGAGGNEILNVNVHDCGQDGYDHGIYLQSHDSKIWNSQFNDCTGFGIHIYQDTEPPQNANVQYNITRGNALSGERSGSGLVARGANHLIANNLSYDNKEYGFMVYNGCLNCKFYNNTSTGNGIGGFYIYGLAVDALLANNIIYESGPAIRDNGSNTVLKTNLTSDPMFTDLTSNDFTLRKGSQAIDMGTALPEIRDDFLGVSRPQGAGFDIGAFEYTGASSTLPKPLPPTIIGTN